MKLMNRVSIVTGAGRGIGKAVSLALAGEGSDVITVDILPETAEITSEEIRAMGRKSLSFEIDVSNAEQVKEMLKKALDAFDRIGILTNVAGTYIKAAIEDVSEKDWDRVMDVNLKGTFLCSQAVGRQMIKQGGGTIINIASVAAHTPQLYLGAYSPSKAGVHLLTKLMAIEWSKYNIRVNAISPGATRTPLFESVYNTEALLAKRAKSVPMNRIGKPEEIAKGVVFFASDEASYITGQTLVIDGGMINSIYYLFGLLSE